MLRVLTEITCITYGLFSKAVMPTKSWKKGELGRNYCPFIAFY